MKKILIVAVMAVLGLFIAAPPAQAAVSASNCGTGYSNYSSTPIVNSSNTTLGYVRIYYKPGATTNKWCAFTEKTYAPLVGVASYTEVEIGPALAFPASIDPANGTTKYKYYAGPVYNNAVTTSPCVSVFGLMKDLADHVSYTQVDNLC